MSKGLRPRGITNLSYTYRMAGLGITNVAQLVKGNIYRIINKTATDGESLGVFTYNGKSQEGLYTFISKNKFDATVTVLMDSGSMNEYTIEEVNKAEGSGGSRKNRRATKKTRRNRRRSSRLRKA